MEGQTEEVKALIKEIKLLENNASFFGMAIKMSAEKNITQIEAWKYLERRRKDLGLNPKFSSKASFFEQKWRFLQTGMEINFDV
jgi:hypothetical protein